MSENAGLYFIHAVSPLHAGVGEGIGAVNLPTARERATAYPFLPGSSVKGVLRELAERTWKSDERKIIGTFGPRQDNAGDARGGIVLTDASLLALPVRSLFAAFAWVTCPYVLKRLVRDAHEAGLAPVDKQAKPRDEKEKEKVRFEALGRLAQGAAIESALIADDSALVGAGSGSGTLLLDELALAGIQKKKEVSDIGDWIASLVWPDPPPLGDSSATNDPERQKQLKEEKDRQQAERKRQVAVQEGARTFFRQRLVITNDSFFGFLTRLGLEVRQRVKINHERGTADDSGPWTEEHMPAETLLFGLVLGRSTRYFDKGRKTDDSGRLGSGEERSAKTSLDDLKSLLGDQSHLRFGGKSTAGMGRARLQVVWP